jgi:ABC-type nitrate/sulfonate/bicarbonate transport system substrate-binding protein
LAILALLAQFAAAAEVTIALPTKSFQQIIFPLALERGYMKEEGIDLKVTFMEPTLSIQALVADSIQLTASGGSALVAIARGGIPAKVVLAVNDRVHQWILSRPNITSIKDSEGGRLPPRALLRCPLSCSKIFCRSTASTVTKMSCLPIPVSAIRP